MATIDDAIFRMVVDLQEAFATETARTVKLAGQQFAEIVDAYRHAATNREWLASANARLAALMQAQVVRAYRDNVLAGAVPSYQHGGKNPTYPGALLHVLESEGFAIGNSRGIGFIDQVELDKQARFWARLNFGAAPNTGGLPPLSGRVQFGANQGVTLRLTSPPSEGFSVPQNMPVGHFNAEGQFFPFAPSRGNREGVTIVKSKPSSRGIGARRFLDAGLVAFGDNFKTVYTEEMDAISRAAAAKATRRVVRG